MSPYFSSTSQFFPCNNHFQVDTDPWVLQTSFANLLKETRLVNPDFFEKAVFDPNPVFSLLSFQKLKELLPLNIEILSALKEVFADSVEIIARKASIAPLRLRTAAIESLAFAPAGLSPGTVERIMLRLPEERNVEGSLSEMPPNLPLLHPSHPFNLEKSFALLISSLALKQFRVDLLKQELAQKNPERRLPALLSLQTSPVPELSEMVLPMTRSPETTLALEASRALFSCSGQKVFLLLLALLKETSDPQKKSGLLGVISQTNREEVWPIFLSHLKHASPLVRKAAVAAIGRFSRKIEEKNSILLPCLSDKAPEVASEAAIWLWRNGSLDALPRLEALLSHGNPQDRGWAAWGLAFFSFSIGVPILSEKFGLEQNADVVREIVLSLRALLSSEDKDFHVAGQLVFNLSRYLESPKPFLATQAAVLCGLLGEVAEDAVLSALEKQEHPNVIASLLSALGRIGTPRMLVLTRFLRHNDSRIRANLMGSFNACGADAIPFLIGGTKDPSPRVKAAAAKSLFKLGHLQAVETLREMLLSPNFLTALSACHTFGYLMKIHPLALNQENPLRASIERESKKFQSSSSNSMIPNISTLPPLLQDRRLPELFERLSKGEFSDHFAKNILESFTQQYPDCYAAKRIFASFLVHLGEPIKAIDFLEICLKKNPGIIADQLDTFRLALSTGNLRLAQTLGSKVRENYSFILSACKAISRDIQGGMAEEINKRFDLLDSPSMNIYSMMIQLKTIQGEKETVLELLSELFLARPTNGSIARHLTALLPDLGNSCILKASLQIYCQKLSC
ncbi:HEAT repeat domain-containing protein [bacterium]|nr:HEAT repeat domain-containing protein [bacterium]